MNIEDLSHSIKFGDRAVRLVMGSFYSGGGRGKGRETRAREPMSQQSILCTLSGRDKCMIYPKFMVQSCTNF